MAISVPQSNAVPLAKSSPVVLGGANVPTTIHITTGATVIVETTLSQGPLIDAGSADWAPWQYGTKSGPFIGTVDVCTAIRLTETTAASSVVNTMR